MSKLSNRPVFVALVIFAFIGFALITVFQFLRNIPGTPWRAKLSLETPQPSSKLSELPLETSVTSVSEADNQTILVVEATPPKKVRKKRVPSVLLTNT